VVAKNDGATQSRIVE